MLRHKVKAGMTGWAQVNGWRGNTLESRIQHDLDYIGNWSIWRDINSYSHRFRRFRNRGTGAYEIDSIPRRADRIPLHFMECPPYSTTHG
jgi:hypothetical protein